MCKKHEKETPKTCCSKGKCCKALEKAAAKQAEKDKAPVDKSADAPSKPSKPPQP